MGSAVKGKDRKIFELELDTFSLAALNRLAASHSVSVERAIALLVESSSLIQLFSISEKRDRRRRYMQGYYKKYPDKFLKGKKAVVEKVPIRVQDRIDQTFRDENTRLRNIKYSFCQNAKCLKPNKKYVEGTGVILDYDGITLYFCNNRCSQEFLDQNEQR